MAVRPHDVVKGINPIGISSETAAEGGGSGGVAEGLGEEAEDVAVDEEFKAIVVENVRSEEDGGEVRKLVNPEAPSQQEVDDHYVRGRSFTL